MRLNAYPANEITANLFKDEVLHLLYFMYHHKEKIPQLRWKALHEVTSLLVSDKFNHPSHQGSAGSWYFHDPLKKLEKEVCENSLQTSILVVFEIALKIVKFVAKS